MLSHHATKFDHHLLDCPVHASHIDTDATCHLTVDFLTSNPSSRTLLTECANGYVRVWVLHIEHLCLLLYRHVRESFIQVICLHRVLVSLSDELLRNLSIEFIVHLDVDLIPFIYCHLGQILHVLALLIEYVLEAFVLCE